ncbi:MAG: glycosyltransferase family 2 protein [Nanoarchaeota archaeon]|nr:glycosyltransferase family 2 protein [Nanoarchaeota archaeon]
MVKISVIIPVYNEEKYLEVAVKSVLNQTDQDFEIVIINDASTDKTKLIAEELVKKDSRIRLINHSVNKFRAAALNTGIKNSKGKYICFLDGDDLYIKDKLEKQSNFLDNNLDIDMIYSDFIIFDEKTERINKSIEFKISPRETLKKASKIKLGLTPPHKLIDIFNEGKIIPSCSPMIRKKVFEKVRFDENLVCAQDYDM